MIDNQLDIYYKNLSSGFNILNINEIDTLGINPEEKGKWNYLIWITEGNSVLHIDFDEFIALENRIFFIEKYKVWNWTRIDKLKGIMVQFTDSYYNHIYTGNPKLRSDQTLTGEIPPFIRIVTTEQKNWSALFDILFREYSEAKKNSTEIICLTLKVLILMYRRNSIFSGPGFDSGQKGQLLTEFRKIVNSRFVSCRTAKDYANELNITPNYLNALCQEYYFKTVSEIIQERVILEAKRLLMHSGLSISEISFKLGFRDNSYFGRYFKKIVGITPKSFRNLSFTSGSG
jgi:AraC family transcriptional regulator, transcriptional activator of pobA